MKLIIPRHSCFGPVYTDEKDEFGLGPFDFALLGPTHIIVYMDGKLNTMEFERRRKPSRLKAGEK